MVARGCPPSRLPEPRPHGRVAARTATDLARAMVAGGWAVDWPRYACGDDADSEAAARSADRGLWPSGELPPDRLRESRQLR